MNTDNITADTVLDSQGLMCPEPVMMLHKAIRGAQSGECIHMLATDPSTQRDVAKFCMHLGHNLIKEQIEQQAQQQDGQGDEGEVYHYWIVKK